MTTSSNIEALIRASKKKKQHTETIVNEVLAQLIANNEKVSFESVARLAGVTKAVLYRNPDLYAKIVEAMAMYKQAVRQTKPHKTKETQKLTTKVQKQEDEIQKLKRQLEAVYGQLYENKII